MKVALDTNILAYAEGVNGVAKRNQALDIVRHLRVEATVIPIQVFGELFNVLVRKAERSRSEARDALQAWRDTFSTIETSSEIMQSATDVATDHKFGIWDAVILAAASHAGCRLLLSEDMQDGFTWGGVTVANPFAAPRNVLLETLLSEASE
ncbi:putative nucleic acid-binding protein [Sphingobium sp. B2D3A]|uniref:PIN domain-containing protein n=1 Tax=unclassified Sphingobium TaxID=2611147 RepID=UPI0022241DEE|nr:MULTISPECIES: PIN domain-containing protein [unclassified Sphingobium]MCW2338215.1 putative nucleic acid-binding protein [Sphingobium sp. B2D3A]MCW2384673.1 putative nucleic acid-binding protein [Sphingobium sp. B2D3D]